MILILQTLYNCSNRESYIQIVRKDIKMLEKTECIAAWYNTDNWQSLTYSEYYSKELKKYK